MLTSSIDPASNPNSTGLLTYKYASACMCSFAHTNILIYVVCGGAVTFVPISFSTLPALTTCEG